MARRGKSAVNRRIKSKQKTIRLRIRRLVRSCNIYTAFFLNFRFRFESIGSKNSGNHGGQNGSSGSNILS